MMHAVVHVRVFGKKPATLVCRREQCCGKCIRVYDQQQPRVFGVVCMPCAWKFCQFVVQLSWGQQ
jgi:hypothetical protein